MELSATGLKTTDEVVAEVMRLNRSLPPRPGIEDVEAAKVLIRNVEKEDQMRLEAIAKQTKGKGIPDELFFILREMQKAVVQFQSMEQKREALKLLDLEHLHSFFDDMIQRASNCVSSPSYPSQQPPPSSSSNFISYSTASGYSNSSSVFSSANTSSSIPSSGTISGGISSGEFPLSNDLSGMYMDKDSVRRRSELLSKDDSFVNKAKTSAFRIDGIGTGFAPPAPKIRDSSLQTGIDSAQNGEKLSLIKLASMIEVSAKKGAKELNLQSKLADQIDWLPDSIGKLSSLVTLDLSENRISTLPATIGGLSSLLRLDLHSNRISDLPESIGNLSTLVFLDLRGNNIAMLPPSICRLIRLEELDVSSNRLSALPDALGSLVSLKKLNVETNDIDEIPYSIGQCTTLQELHADYNRIKALPEAVGKIESLEVLSVRYNNIRMLPSTVSSLTKLKELDLSFNELEGVNENLCFATSLTKLNVGNNFADLRSLPRNIGNLEMLEELDISNNQIRVLPESFRLLGRLRILRVEENPLEIPPRHVADKGAQAVVQYMEELYVNKDVKKPQEKKKSWIQRCFSSRSNKRKRENNLDFMKDDVHVGKP